MNKKGKQKMGNKKSEFHNRLDKFSASKNMREALCCMQWRRQSENVLIETNDDSMELTWQGQGRTSDSTQPETIMCKGSF